MLCSRYSGAIQRHRFRQPLVDSYKTPLRLCRQLKPRPAQIWVVERAEEPSVAQPIDSELQRIETGRPPMTRETKTRAQIALLAYMMTEGVLFGAGVVLVLTWPALSADTGFWIVTVVVASIILAAPIAWWIAPRMRARHWRRNRLKKTFSALSAQS
jgi:hypothetical protein